MVLFCRTMVGLFPHTPDPKREDKTMMRRILGLILVLSITFTARLASADDWEEGWMKEVRGVEPPPKVCQMIYDHDWPTKEGLELPGAREKEAEFNRSIARELVDVLRSHDRTVRERTTS